VFGPRTLGPKHALVASVLPQVRQFEYTPDETDRQTDGQTDTRPMHARCPQDARGDQNNN